MIERIMNSAISAENDFNQSSSWFLGNNLVWNELQSDLDLSLTKVNHIWKYQVKQTLVMICLIIVDPSSMNLMVSLMPTSYNLKII